MNQPKRSQKRQRRKKRSHMDGETMRHVHRWDVIGRMWGKLFNPQIAWPASVAVSSYFLAGKETIIDLKNLSLSFFGIQIAASNLLVIAAGSIFFGVGAIIWARYKVTECYDNVAYLSERNAKLEALKDPDRQSSMLEPTGETRKEDRR